jgi:hypothetical protein
VRWNVNEAPLSGVCVGRILSGAEDLGRSSPMVLETRFTTDRAPRRPEALMEIRQNDLGRA